MTYLPADEDLRTRLLMSWRQYADDPEGVNPVYLGEIVRTLIRELVIAWEQLELLEQIDEAGRDE